MMLQDPFLTTSRTLCGCRQHWLGTSDQNNVHLQLSESQILLVA